VATVASNYSGRLSVDEGIRRYNAKVRRHLRKKSESKSLHGRTLYKHLIRQLHSALKSLLKETLKGKAGQHRHSLSVIIPIPSQLTAHLALVTVLDSLQVPQKRTALAYQVGRGLIDEMHFRKLKKTYPIWWQSLHSKVLRRSSYRFRRNLAVRAANQDLGADWREPVGRDRQIQLGIIMLELIRTSTGLIQYEKRAFGRAKTIYYVGPTIETLRWIDRFHKKVSMCSPYYLPVTERPPDWISATEGGYELPEEIDWHFVKQTNSGRRQSRENYSTQSLSLAFRAANRLQQVPLQVTSRCLSVLSELFKEGKDDRLTDGRTNRGTVGWEPNDTAGYRRCQALFYARQRKAIPKLLMRSSLLHRARSCGDSKVYFPVQADFRGRLYYVPKVFNPQGPDEAKGLLEFSEARRVAGSEHWFLIGGANRYGIKGTFEEREEWAVKHEKYIRAVANDPLSNKSFWRDSECPTEFLQWCFEFNEWMSNRIGFQSRLPVKLDHSASGLQIIALLKGDKELQRLTNLTDSKEPVDLYSLLLLSIREKIIASCRPESLRWLALGLNRKVIKQLTIMYMYGGTPHGMQQSIVSWYVSLDGDPFGKTIYNEIANLLNIYHEALDDLSDSPRMFMKDCRELQKPDEILSWVSPSGFPVSNVYRQTQSTRHRSTINGERVSFHITKDTNKLALGRARNAVAANLVHSYDAAILHQVVAEFEQPLVSLHDCYGVHPSNCDALRECVQTTICRTFRVDTHNIWYYFLS